MLVVMVNGRETYRLALRTELSSDHTRSLFVPLSELAGGESYSSIELYLIGRTSAHSLTADSIDYTSFGEINDYDNHVTLYPVYDFYFSVEPQSANAFVGQDVTLTAEAAGTSGPFAYQWVEVNPDGTLRGETGTTLTLSAVTLASNATKYLCIATNSQNVQLSSSTAALTVTELPPTTGDASHPAAWLLLLSASAALLVLLLIRRRRG